MKKVFIILIIIVGLFATVSLSYAQNDLQAQVSGQLDAGAAKAGLKTDQPVNPAVMVAIIIQMVLGLVGIIFVILMVIGGYNFITAHGEEEKAQKGVKMIEGAAIGLGIILAAYSITYFVGRQIPAAIYNSDYRASDSGGGYDLEAGTTDIRDVGANAAELFGN